MPRYNVQHNGKWACFSSVVDDFVTEFMDKSAYEDWRKCEYGVAELRNLMSIEDAVFSITLNRSRDEALHSLEEVGFTPEESELLMRECENKYYTPRPDGNGGYTCPNCHSSVSEGQEDCVNDTCCIRLAWELTAPSRRTEANR